MLASFGEPEDPRLGVIDHDDAAAMEVIVDHLYGLGHRRVAFASQHLREYGGERRRLGFASALARRGLPAVARVALRINAAGGIPGIAIRVGGLAVYQKLLPHLGEAGTAVFAVEDVE